MRILFCLFDFPMIFVLVEENITITFNSHIHSYKRCYIRGDAYFSAGKKEFQKNRERKQYSIYIWNIDVIDHNCVRVWLKYCQVSLVYRTIQNTSHVVGLNQLYNHSGRSKSFTVLCQKKIQGYMRWDAKQNTWLRVKWDTLNNYSNTILVIGFDQRNGAIN